MFDALKNIGSLPGLMAKAREMQDKMQAMQEELARKTVTADAGAGAVEATCNGRLELVRVRIQKDRLPNPDDTEMLEDLIVAAVHAAQGKAADLAKSEMQRAAGEMGLPPGMLPS
jgi:DNA-binding YbaB/EbfC family protein